uniref:Uncharacterized protein n=1 Tax=Anguilla anguilla TaxID=7936 RepID=A0A0E9UAE1_ANGAN
MERVLLSMTAFLFLFIYEGAALCSKVRLTPWLVSVV